MARRLINSLAVSLLIAWLACLAPAHQHGLPFPHDDHAEHAHLNHPADAHHEDAHDDNTNPDACPTCWLISTLTVCTPPPELPALDRANRLTPPALTPLPGVAWILHQRGRSPPVSAPI